MAITTITSKGQITIPAEIRQREGFHPGDQVRVREVNGQIVIESTRSAVDRLVGMLSQYAAGRPPATLEEWDEAAAAGIAREPLHEAE